MANDINAVFITLGDDCQLGIVFDAITGVHELAIHLSGKGGFGKVMLVRKRAPPGEGRLYAMKVR